MKKIMVVIGSARQGRAADKIVQLVSNELAKHPDLKVDIADLKEVGLPFYDHPLPPSMPGFEYQTPETKQWGERVAANDGFIFLTPEYNHSTSAILKNAIDWVYTGWNNKPVAFVSWGVDSGVRAVEHLRQIVQWPMLTPLLTATHIPLFTAFDKDGKLVDNSVSVKLARTVDELEKSLK
jgi:NAD(P)H-dependent FMN reductase